MHHKNKISCVIKQISHAPYQKTNSLSRSKKNSKFFYSFSLDFKLDPAVALSQVWRWIFGQIHLQFVTAVIASDRSFICFIYLLLFIYLLNI